MFRMHRGTGHRSGYELAQRYQRHFRVTQLTQREEAPMFFHSLGVGMEASEARREDGVSSADDCENLPNCAQMFALQPLPTSTASSPSSAASSGRPNCALRHFYSRHRSRRRADGPSQTTWKPPRPLGEAASRSPVTAEANRKWGMWLTVVLRDAELKIGVGGG